MGKTYSLKMFAENNFKSYLYINFEEEERLIPIFDKDLNPFRILQDISIRLEAQIDVREDLLILDEPASGLDPRARVEVKALLKELRRMGKTILISSHILTELADCCTQIGIIERGQLLMHGPIDEVYRRIRGDRLVIVRFTEQMDVGLSIIRSSPYVRNVQVDDHGATLELQTDDSGVAELLNQLVTQGVGIRSFAEKEPTLEDVFMMVTKGLVS